MPEEGARAIITQSKLPIPRQLLDTETFESLKHWKNCFRNFYRRDSYFAFFLRSNTKWDPTKEDYGFTSSSETDGLKRLPIDLKDDLVAFLNIIAGFLPHSYITERFEQATTCLDDVWNILDEIYNAQITSSSLLDFANIKKTNSESHRQFFERLSNYIRQHLAKANLNIDGLSSGQNGDKMTISLLNLVVVNWLDKTDPKLIEIVKHEYATDLRNGQQLIQLMPKIASSIDSLLRKNDSSMVNRMRTCEVDDLEEDDTADDTQINKIKKKEMNKNRRFLRLDNENTCHHCVYLSKDLDIFIDTKHNPKMCKRKKKAIQSVNAEINSSDSGRNETSLKINKFDELQNESNGEIYASEKLPTSGSRKSSHNCSNDMNMLNHSKENSSFNASDLSQVHDVSKYQRMLKETDDSNQTFSPTAERLHPDLDRYLGSKIKNITSKLRSLNAVSKAKSPAFIGQIDRIKVLVTVDEGAELNCIDSIVAKKANVKISNTSQKATAAGCNNIDIIGQTEKDLKIRSKFDGKEIELNLGRAIVVQNLGTELLLGEPGKKDNNIITIARDKIITITIEGETFSTPYISADVKTKAYHVCRVNESEIVYPGEELKWKPPEQWLQYRALSVSPRLEDKFWFNPGIYLISSSGEIEIKNTSPHPIKLNKGKTFAEIRPAFKVDVKKEKTLYEGKETTMDSRISPVVCKLVNLDDDPLVYMDTRPDKEKNERSYTDMVSIDPDNQLSESERSKFRDICEEFTSIITPAPGKYNGYYGDSDPSINFTSVPPPNMKVYTPKYSTEMNRILAEKMDQLHEFGVLRRPEELGISVEFVSPCLVVPKGDGDGYRLVTDFSALNVHVKKFPSTSPTIAQAKIALASKKYHIHMDLANYFYQSGVRKEDAQYLGVMHPFKGLLVYVVRPQGLKNASEQAYETLAKVFGDMVMDGKMTRMADGLFVLADSIVELLDNFQEALTRIKNSNLTLKPSKLIIVPRETIVFGWSLKDGKWSPTEHTIVTLSRAELPSTVKKLRSFLGSVKQLTDCMERYAELMSPMEKMVAGRQSAERLVWSDEDKKHFENVKNTVANLNGIHRLEPRQTLRTLI